MGQGHVAVVQLTLPAMVTVLSVILQRSLVVLCRSVGTRPVGLERGTKAQPWAVPEGNPSEDVS